MKFGGIWRPPTSTSGLDPKLWYVKLLPRSGGGVGLVACRADGSTLLRGNLLDLGVGGLQLHSSVNESLGLPLSSRGRLLTRGEVEASKEDSDLDDDDDDE